jgi:hypothetical protein
MGAMALHGYSSMELKSRSFTSKEPHVAREPQVADPWPRSPKNFLLFSFPNNILHTFIISSIHATYGTPFIPFQLITPVTSDVYFSS